MTDSAAPRLVILDYDDISSDPAAVDISSQLERAFGGNTSSSSSPSPLGIVAVRNVPGFLHAKRAFLPQGHALAHLDASALDELSDPPSLYNAGWSRGKEKLGDRPDYSKGSFYFNPLTDTPGAPGEREKYPASYPRNKWPEEAGGLRGFRDNARRLGNIMHRCVILLSRHIDRLARRAEGYESDLLYDAMKETEKAKGRLLYYYPLDDAATSFDNWIGWHNDSGFLTALAGDLYVDHDTGTPTDETDSEAGLYVADRSGKSIRVVVPEDCMAVQIGECVQILTGGVVSATPHCVRGPKKGGVARISCPCFIDSKPTFVLKCPEGREGQVLKAGIGREKVPKLEERWVDGMTFGDFLQKSFEKYYDWKR